MLLHEMLEASARVAPHRTALVCGESRVSYGELDAASRAAAAGLTAAGVQRGDRVAVLLDSSVEAVVAVFGILRAGAAFTVLHGGTKPTRLAAVLRDEGAVALVIAGDARRRAVLDAAIDETVLSTVVWVGAVPGGARPGTTYLGWEDLLLTGRCTLSTRAPASPPEPLTPDDLGTLIYTSGTTGEPRGVVCHHADMAFATRAIAGYLGNTADDVILCALPLAFTYGLYQLLTSVLVGATLVLEPGFAFPQTVLATMQRERVTGLPGVPTMFATLLGASNLREFDLSALRYLTNAAAALPEPRLRQLRAAFPQAQLFCMYGQTESKRTCFLPPEELDRRPGSVGVPLPGTEVRVVDADGTPVPPGGVGELVVRGPHLMHGYWNRPEETALRLRPGPRPGERELWTGDLFRTDAEGFLYFVSRSDDVIKSRGEKVSPDEVESALLRLPGVLDVAAVGVPDELLGEAVKVFVVTAPGAGLTERDVRAHCARELEEVKVPRHVEFRDSLERSENGKTLRRLLRPCVA